MRAFRHLISVGRQLDSSCIVAFSGAVQVPLLVTAVLQWVPVLHACGAHDADDAILQLPTPAAALYLLPRTPIRWEAQRKKLIPTRFETQRKGCSCYATTQRLQLLRQCTSAIAAHAVSGPSAFALQPRTSISIARSVWLMGIAPSGGGAGGREKRPPSAGILQWLAGPCDDGAAHEAAAVVQQQHLKFEFRCF